MDDSSSKGSVLWSALVFWLCASLRDHAEEGSQAMQWVAGGKDTTTTQLTRRRRIVPFQF